MRIESLLEGAHLAIDQLRANKFRSALTILGIVVGVATVMAMSALITGIKTSITESMEAAGPNNFMLARYDWNAVQVNTDGPPWGNNPPITLQETDRLNDVPGVRRTIPGVEGSAEITAGNQRIANVQIWGRGAGWREYTQGNFTAGHDFLPSDVESSRPVIIVSEELARSLFGPLDPIGRSVRVRGEQFEVIGVYEMSANIFANFLKNFAIVPHTAAIKYLRFNEEMLMALVATASNTTQDEAMERVMTSLRVMRGLRPSEPNNFALIRQEEMAKSFNRVTNVFFLVMLALSSVALMVGGVGVVAIMMIAVTERTREIGVRKALGATRREILWQFLFESSTVTFIGGAIGMIFGGTIAFLVAALTPIPARVPLFAIVAALGMAVVAGVLFGLVPAWRAARMDPVVALRYE